MSENFKNYACLFIAIIFLPCAMYFFIKVCGSEMLDLIAWGDVIYFDWRSLPMLSVMPAFLVIELTLVSCLFTRNKKVYPGLLNVMNKVLIYTLFLFFFFILSGPVFSVAFYFTPYHSCPASSMFSGVYYVRDKTKCYALNGVIPWSEGYGYQDDEKK